MKNITNPVAVTGAIALGVAGLAGASKLGLMPCCGGMMTTSQHTSAPVVATNLNEVQKATVIIDGGYSPAVIEVKQGKPVELTFTGGKNLGCGGTVVFESLKITKAVATGESVVVNFTPMEKGEIPFACSMGMLRGKVIIT